MQGSIDNIEYTVDILVYLVVPESQNNEALLAQPSIAFRIVISLSPMLPAIKLDNQSPFKTNKIRNIIS